ncbi:MAG: type IV pili twitching motility protein PilT, partial [Pseudomonadota bacterium]
MEVLPFLRAMVDNLASDLFISAGVAPSMKVNGKVTPINDQIMTPDEVRETVLGVMNDYQKKEFLETKE